MSRNVTRAPLSVVVVQDNKRRGRELLRSLTEQLAPGDDIMITSPGAASASSAWHVRHGGELCRRTGDAGRLHDLVLLIEARVLVSHGLVDSLTTTASSPSVGAVAPRANAAAGDDLLLGPPYRADDAAARRATLARWAATRSGTTPVSSLGGPCVLLRRRHVELAGGPVSLGSGTGRARAEAFARDEGLSLVVAEGAYVHHLGGPLLLAPSGWPLVSACLIVKDEVEQLETCLASAAGVADEIIVYDTGSTDDTVALARRLGAKVIEGCWDDDFSRARNAALGHARGQWVLWLDADETLSCKDPSALRVTLAEGPAEVEGYLVPIDNLKGTDAATVLTHPAVRLFRRASCQWEGRLHEQVVRRAGSRPPSLKAVASTRIVHRGYLQRAFEQRDKAARNLRSAFSDLAAGSALDRATRLLSLGRSYLLAGRHHEGAALCERARQLAETPSTTRLALRVLADAYLATDRPREALAIASDLRLAGRVTTLADIVEGRALRALGDLEGALAAFERVRQSVDEDGVEYQASLVADHRAQVLADLGRDGEAADVLLEALRSAGGLDVHLGLLIEVVERSGKGLDAIFAALPQGRAVAFLPQLLQLQADVADRVLESWHVAARDGLPVLATAAQVSHRLPVNRQLVWSARLRAAGLESACPLVACATALDVPATDRAIATAAAWASFGDPRARLAFVASALQVPRQDRGELGAAIRALAPALAETFDDVIHSDDTLGDADGRPDARVAEPAPCRRHVVVVARTVSSLWGIVRAAAIAQMGHDTVLLHPQPALPSEHLLAHHGVTVRGWVEATDADWSVACRSAIARQYATSPVDLLVLGPGIEELSADLASLVPAADILMSDQLPSTPAQWAHVFEPFNRPLPAAARTGVCLVGNLRGEGADPGRLLVEGLVRSIAELMPTTPVCFCGDDPARLVSRTAPQVLHVGPVADATPWLRSSQAVLLLPGTEGMEAWRELAAASGTPLIVVTPRDGHAAVASLASLIADERAWEVAAAAPASSDAPKALPIPIPAQRRHHRAILRAHRRPLVRLASPVGGTDSLAQVNRQLLGHLAKRANSFDLLVATPEPLPLPGEAARALDGVPVRPLAGAPAADLEIRHQWPPDFRPAGGRLVCIQPFEYGGLPAEWIGSLRDHADELWVPTAWVRDAALASGLAESKVHVVPNGVDVARFRPEGRVHPLRTTKSTKLLFVGGCIERKGIDALLETYLATFDASDDVCLVVKPYGAAGVYRNANLEADVRRAAAGSGAEIEVVNDSLSAEDLAALYRACNALVHPYRGEGFGLPVAEAMASGLPVIVTEGGACDAFCDGQVGWLVPGRKVVLHPADWTPGPGGAWWLEPDRAALASALRSAAENPEAARRRGAAARARVVSTLTWDHAAAVAAERIEALLEDAGTDGTRPESAAFVPTTIGASR